MAFDVNEISVSFEQGEDLSSDQFKFVKLQAGVTGMLGTVVKSGPLERAIGIVKNIPSGAAYNGIGESGPMGPQIPASVVIDGITRLRVDAAYASGTLFAGATGTVAGVGTEVGASYARAISLEGSQEADDVVTVRLIN